MSLLNIGVRNAVRIDIPDADTLRTVDHLAPLAVDVQTLVDPETPRILDFRIADAVNAVGLGGRVLIIVRRLDVGVVQDIAGRVERACAVLVKEPADEFIVVARTVGRADRAAVIDTEAHGLICRAPVQRGVSRIHSRVHEHTDLRAVPLGIHRHAADRHRLEVILRGAGLVDVPAGEGITLLRGLEAGVSVRIERVIVVRRDILQIRDLLGDRLAAGELVVCRRVVGVDLVVAVIAGAVDKGDIILRAQIIEIRCSVEIRRSVICLELRIRQPKIDRRTVRNVIALVIFIIVVACYMRHITVITGQGNEVLFICDKTILRPCCRILFEMDSVIFRIICFVSADLDIEIERLCKI